MNLIEKAVFPLKEQAVNHAEQMIKEHIENALSKLEAVNYDISTLMPYPDSNFAVSADYKRYNAQIAFYRSITSFESSEFAIPYPSEENCYTRYETPTINKPNQEKIEKTIQNFKDNAAARYDSFVAKLIGKIGNVQSATLNGDAVWEWSFLKVITEAGDHEVWKTQMIVNCSSLGLLFNQWPTRKVKV